MERVVTIPAPYLNTTIFMGNVQKKLERSRGFYPRRFGSPQMQLLLNRYYVILAQNAGVVRGERHGPFLHRTGAFYFIVG
jgi:hypothetical protein